jgi:ABC-type nitrate/sulfonate/bicarbonate transport system ATPase subunit
LNQALARTLAFRPSIVLLDDVFSAIDRTTEKHITDRLFGKTGIFRQLGTTVIQVVQDSEYNPSDDIRYFNNHTIRAACHNGR